jgi:hypothetical protein
LLIAVSIPNFINGGGDGFSISIFEVLNPISVAETVEKRPIDPEIENLINVRLLSR